MKKKFWIILLLTFLFILIICYFFNAIHIIPHKKNLNDDFDIEPYISKIDKDNDGIDDQTDILNSTRKYIATNPKYKIKYYIKGYPDDGYGVCTDVVAFALKDAGYDLMNLVHEHIKENIDLYDIKIIDKNIDFRRVQNLNIYLKNTAISLTTDVNEVEQWQGGDIVVFEKHIGIISDKRNKSGVSFVLHHANPYQIYYEEDILQQRNDIIGHYRIS